MMQRTKRPFALFLAMIFVLSLFSCGRAKQPDDAASQTSDPAGDEPSVSDDLFAEPDGVDTLFPDERYTTVRLGTLENYKILRDAAAEGGEALEQALTFAREELKNAGLLNTTAQIEALVKEIGKLPIVVPASEDWQSTSLQRGFVAIVNEDSGYVDEWTHLFIRYENAAVGTISLSVNYNQKAARSEREFYHKHLEGTGVGEYISPEPYFQKTLATGESFIFYEPSNALEGNFLLAGGCEIIFSFDYGDTDDGATPTTDEEKLAIVESIINSFFDGASVMTLDEAVGS